MKMYDNILQKVAQYEEKRGIVYAKTDGKLYKTLKVLYVLIFCYTMVMNTFFLLGTSLSETVFNALKNSIYTVIGLSVSLIASLVIMRFKNKIWANIVSLVLNVLSCTGLCFTFGVLLQDVIGFKVSFYWRHLAPLCLMVALSVALFIVAIKAILKTQKNYKKIVDNIYTSHSVSAEDSNFTAEEWDEILKNI